MSWLAYPRGVLFAEGIPVAELAERFGTPLYVYSAPQIRDNLDQLRRAFSGLPIRLFYAVKANANRAILTILAHEGLGAEVVSRGELERALRAGFRPEHILFTGVGKTSDEIAFALTQGIFALVVESLEELQAVSEIAQRKGRRARVGLRINPALDPGTHPHLATGKGGSKFGIDPAHVEQALPAIGLSPHLSLAGFHVHLGSQIAVVEPYLAAFELLVGLWRKAQDYGLSPSFLDLGGGFAVPHQGDEHFPFEKLVSAIKERIPVGGQVLFEPGRFLVAEAGALLTRVLYVKEVRGKRFVVVDAGMNDLLRPALYGAVHPVWPAELRPGPRLRVDLVGPVCENADSFGQELELPPLHPGDVLAIGQAGAYGFAMASQYNSRPRPAEVLLLHGEAYLIRRRETLEDLWQGEEVPPCLDG